MKPMLTSITTSTASSRAKATAKAAMRSTGIVSVVYGAMFGLQDFAVLVEEKHDMV